jgi:lipoprotein-anchoring transpeptidase ErfK/SrfK
MAVFLTGCSNSRLDPALEASLKPRDRQLLASARYSNAPLSESYQRHVVNYHRKELAGTIVVDPDARFLYYVMPGGKAIRYGVAVGEEALSFSGIAKVGRLAEWPDWVPTKDIKRRIANLPDRMPGGVDNPMGARGIYLFAGDRDTLFRIHGTNQPELIGQAVSSGCIRMTNEDVIDLYNRVKMGSPVVVLAPHNGDSPFNPRVASTSGLSDGGTR